MQFVTSLIQCLHSYKAHRIEKEPFL